MTALEDHDLRALGPGLPPEVEALLGALPLPGQWVPGTMSDAVFYAIVDTFYPTEELALEWTYERTMRAANSRLYRALAYVASPFRWLRVAATVHGRFQRGTDLSVEATDAGARVVLTHPPHLHGGLNHLCNVPMFRALLEIAGIGAPLVEMIESEPKRAVYRTVWR